MLLLSLQIEILFNQLGLLEMSKSCVGKLNILLIFLFLVPHKITFVPFIFGRPFLNTFNAKIDCEKDGVTIGLGDMTHEFNFAKFRRQPHDKELPSKDEIIGLASIDVPPADPLEQYLLDHENDLHMGERNEIDRIFVEQQPLLKHNLPIETLGGPPPPKGDPVFELK